MMTIPEPDQLKAYLRLAESAAEAAEQIILRHFHGRFEVHQKSDRTPVTDADIAAEACIRQMIRTECPDHGWYGEESGRSNQQAPLQWLVDPIDGTKSFVRGSPYFSTQIALMASGRLILGVSNAPLARERCLAIHTPDCSEVHLNGSPLRCSEVSTLDQAVLSSGNIASLATSPQWSAFGRLLARVNKTRGYGDYCHYHMLASGQLDIVIESDLNILDIAALCVAVEAAGGRMTDLSGSPVTLSTRSILATNGHLHDRVLECLNES